jgi:hypothetical protein
VRSPIDPAEPPQETPLGLEAVPELGELMAVLERIEMGMLP